MDSQHGIREFNNAQRMIGIEPKQTFCCVPLDFPEFQKNGVCHRLQHLFLERVLQSIHMLGFAPLIWMQEQLEVSHDFVPISREILGSLWSLSKSRRCVIKPLGVVFVEHKRGEPRNRIGLLTPNADEKQSSDRGKTSIFLSICPRKRRKVWDRWVWLIQVFGPNSTRSPSEFNKVRIRNSVPWG
jgi:hypothetical protein